MGRIQLAAHPHVLLVSRGRTVLTTGMDGMVHEGEEGLSSHQTRMCSLWELRVDGKVPETIAASNTEQHAQLVYLSMFPPGAPVPPVDEGSGQVDPQSERTLETRIFRHVDGGLHEDLDITLHSDLASRFEVRLRVDGDFADVLETRGRRRQQGVKTVRFDDGKLALAYTAVHGERSIARGVNLVVDAPSDARWDGEALCWDVELQPHERWHACLRWSPVVDGKTISAPVLCYAQRGRRGAQDTHFSTDGGELAHSVGAALRTARDDLDALRLEVDDGGWTVAAGLPMYATLFGRDALTAGWQSAMGGTEILQGSLHEMARLQGRERNDWRDEMPGRMLHEAHVGPIAALGIDPRGRNYGTVTTSGFFPFALGELWHWTGDRARVEPLMEPALRALAWLDDDVRGEDGFYRYRTRSAQGVVHQAWKDAPGAIVDGEGREIDPPIATSEEQGFAYAAKLHLASVLWMFSRRDDARRLFKEARALRRAFNAAFWLEEKNLLAMALGPDGRPVDSMGSNAGHCVATGILEEGLVPRVVKRLLERDMFSGWGVRTLSSENPAYNPLSYHRGSVWPVEHGTFALGFWRYGLTPALHDIARSLFELSSLFAHHRLPELVSGHTRCVETPFPALYLKANSPQAWSASSVFASVQALLGLYPYAPRKALFVDPRLPDWLPSLRIDALKVGDARVSLRFTRSDDGKSHVEVLRKHGTLHVIRQASPWSVTTSWARRMVDLVKSVA